MIQTYSTNQDVEKSIETCCSDTRIVKFIRSYFCRQQKFYSMRPDYGTA